MTDYNAEQLAQGFLAANPALVPRPHGQQGPPPAPATIVGACNSVRVTQAGGALASLLMHPTFVPLEHLYRKLPEASMFAATPEAPFKYELGAFSIPNSMAFVFVDYKFRLFRLSGAAAGDTVPLEDERLSTVMGFDVDISSYRQGQLFYEIDPVAVTATREGTSTTSGGSVGAPSENTDFRADFPSGGLPRATQEQFTTAQFVRSAQPAGAGASLLPQTSQRQGPLPLPFSLYVKSGQTVRFFGIVFRPIPIPIAFTEVSVTGLLMPQNTLDAMLNGLKPCVQDGGGV
jgi:hypothetical protein